MKLYIINNLYFKANLKIYYKEKLIKEEKIYNTYKIELPKNKLYKIILNENIKYIYLKENETIVFEKNIIIKLKDANYKNLKIEKGVIKIWPNLTQ